MDRPAPFLTFRRGSTAELDRSTARADRRRRSDKDRWRHPRARRVVRSFSACLFLLGLPTSVALAQPFPLDPAEFQVNTLTTGAQYADDIATLPNGQFVVVWSSAVSAGDDVDGLSIQAQRWAADGTRIGDQFQVNTFTTSDQWISSVAAAPDGTYFVAWTSNVGLSGSSEFFSVFGRAFAPDGTPLQSSDQQLNTYTTGTQFARQVAALSSGEFVVIWSSTGSWGTDNDGRSVQARLVDSYGVALGPSEFQVNTYTTGAQSAGGVAADGSNRFIVAWTSAGSLGTDQSDNSVQARRFDATGAALDATEFQVNTQTIFYQEGGLVAAAPDGDFVVAWTDAYDPVGDDHIGVKARRFASDGTPLDPSDFQVNTYTPTGQRASDVEIDAEGNFVVAWYSVGSAGPDGDGSSQIRRYRADGSPVDPVEFQLNVFTTGTEGPPRLALTADGDLIAVWTSPGSYGTDNDLYSAQARRFSRPRIPVTSTSGGTGGPDCTLRDAVAAANSDSAVGGCPAGSGGGVVVLPPRATINLTAVDNGSNALPLVTSPVILRGSETRVQRAAWLACDGGPGMRLAEVADGGLLTLDGLVLARGCLPGTDIGGGVLVSGGTLVLQGASVEASAAGSGGGIAVDGGGLYLFDSTIRDNRADESGGGLAILSPADVVRISGSTLSGNRALWGGAAAVAAQAPFSVINSTFSGNLATGSAGGLLVAAPGAAAGLDFTTVTGNAAPFGAGLLVAGGSARLHGSLVGDNSGLGADCAAPGSGALEASGANLDTDGSCAWLAGGAVETVADLGLSPLGSYGGATRTHLPLAGSAALDALADCRTSRGAPLLVDQRGLPRPVDDPGAPGSGCDLGAVEGSPIFVDGFESGDAAAWTATLP
jgi:hypothetical protein